MRKHTLAIYAIGAIASMFSPSAKAGGLFLCAGHNNADADTTARDLHTLEVRAASGRNPRLSGSPRQTLDPEEIRTRGITDISDALRRMAGVSMRDYGGEGGMKTLSLRGLGTQHTGVVYDGIALSDLQSGQIDLSRYSLGTLGTITVNHGDDDDIFLTARASASASTLSISTSSDAALNSRDLQLKASVKGGSFGYYSPAIYIDKRFGKHFRGSAIGEYTHSDNNFPITIKNGPETLHEKRKNSDLNSGHGEINFGWTPDDQSDLNLKIYGYGKKQHLPGPVILYSPDNNERLSEGNFFTQAHYKTQLHPKWKLMANGKFSWARTHYTDVSGIYPGGVLDNRYMQREAYLSAATQFRPISSLALSYAVDWSYNNLTETIPNPPRPYRNSVLQALALKWNVWRLTLTARGLLSLYYNGAVGANAGKNARRLSPSLSLTVKPFRNTDFRIRASYKNIFRMPSFNELYFNHYGTINLDPEIAEQFNAGVTYATPAHPLYSISVTADGYLNYVRNKIVAMPYNMFLMTLTNLDKVRIAGADITLAADVEPYHGQKISLHATYSYQRAANRSSRDRLDWNKQVAYTPLNSGAASLSWENPWVSAAIHGTGCSTRYANNLNLETGRIPGYVECGASVWHIFRFGGHSLEIRADLLNAFDTRYELVSRYPMPGRSWQASATFQL